MKKAIQVKKNIDRLKEQIINIGDMRPGSLSRQSRSWGKEYWQISYTHRGRGRTGYVSEKNYPRVKKEIKNHKIFKEYCKKLIDLSLEYAKLIDKENDS